MQAGAKEGFVRLAPHSPTPRHRGEQLLETESRELTLPANVLGPGQVTALPSSRPSTLLQEEINQCKAASAKISTLALLADCLHFRDG